MLRKRKTRRYNEEINDEEGDGERKFDLREQIKSPRFELIKDKHLKELPGEAITLELIQRDGFERPILVKEPIGLDLRVPRKNFLVRDVRNCVGHDRIIDVMDVKTQKNIEMSMRDWCKYYESKNRDRLLNVISLEFSHTKLEELVDSPKIVKLLDWVDLVWPKFLKQSQIESTNTIDKMKYPKVQKYCLMSVKGSYTDFHIDFGGTSVWYHILKGKKIFWMVPPTELNLSTFEEWTLSGMQQDVFFGDTVEECFRVELSAGNTFFIPSGWIHAVYTLEDSLVFGGNFLHSFGIENQLKVSKIEDATKVPLKFRYPFYTEVLWYVVQHYVFCLTKRDHLHRPEMKAVQKPDETTEKTVVKKEIEDETTESEPEESCDNNKKKNKNSKAKRRSKVSTKASASKKQKKKPPTDDDSTEIDSANEDDVPVKPVSTTCRMTKNSLLRLQYEVEETPTTQVNQTNQKQSPTKNLDKGDVEKKCSTVIKNEPQNDQTKKLSSGSLLSPTINQNSTLIATDVNSSQDSKLNGFAVQTSWSNVDVESNEPIKVHLTRFEINGLKALVKHLSKLSGAKKNLPSLIRNSRTLLDDCRRMLAEHENDDPLLAITGKPITPDILNTKRADINELIGQFFKPIDRAGHNDKPALSITTQVSSTMKSDVLTQQHKMKQQLNTDALSSFRDERKSTTNASTLSSSNSSSETNPSSPTKLSSQKETKCLSPTKKSLAANASSPPPRPKSPPTRPLSNNQYISKTKAAQSNNNNLLLPGSFADLIAATTTEKKVFDVASSDITSSLFGIKDLNSSSKATTQTIANVSKSTNQDKLSFKTGKSSESTTPTQNITHGSNTCSSSITNATNSYSAQSRFPSVSKPISPEPPKSTTPTVSNATNNSKRFINPSFRPPNKEKLIYASAPYVSPVSEQPRTTLYPWQTPTSTPPSQQSQTKPMHHSGQSSAITPHPVHESSPILPAHSNAPGAIYTPEPRLTSNEVRASIQTLLPQTSSETNSSSSEKPKTTEPKLPKKTIKSDNNMQTNDINVDYSTSLTDKIDRTVSKLDRPGNQDKSELINMAKDLTIQGNEISSNSVKTNDSELITIKVVDNSLNTNDSDQKLTKVTKPRGPPKKSKEARQALDNCVDDKSLPVTVPILPQTHQINPSSSSVVQPQNQAPTKTKTKKSKKSKDGPQINTAQSMLDQQVESNINAFMGQPMNQASSVVCGLVAQPPPVTSAGIRINPQSYLISRPLLFNPMSALSTAQFQQMARASMPILTNSMAATSLAGLPMQQGARIVWATQPRGMAGPPTTSCVAPMINTAQIRPSLAKTASSNTRPNQISNVGGVSGNNNNGAVNPSPSMPSTNPSDNAALLSLATTALSTASMTSSPVLTQMSSHAPLTAQAIMVNSVANRQALLARQQQQQFMRPVVQRVQPMTHFLAPRPGLPMAPGSQLVFARLPNQTQQARFLITQPGFLPQRLQGQQIVTSQPSAASTLAFASAYKPSTADSTKGIKTKKVKTS